MLACFHGDPPRTAQPMPERLGTTRPSPVGGLGMRISDEAREGLPATRVFLAAGLLPGGVDLVDHVEQRLRVGGVGPVDALTFDTCLVAFQNSSAGSARPRDARLEIAGAHMDVEVVRADQVGPVLLDGHRSGPERERSWLAAYFSLILWQDSASMRACSGS